jgi:hypothetical protein
MVKRIEKHPGKLVLRSDNKVYEPIYLSTNEMDSFRIIGKVVWVSRDVQQFADGYYLNFERVKGLHINFHARFRYHMMADPIPALKNSRFIRAILEMEISLGHSASHSLSLEQFPKQSSSIFRTMARARWAASGLP